MFGRERKLRAKIGTQNIRLVLTDAGTMRERTRERKTEREKERKREREKERKRKREKEKKRDREKRDKEVVCRRLGWCVRGERVACNVVRALMFCDRSLH